MRTKEDVKKRIDALISDLCFALDDMVYLPVKREIAGSGAQHSLGLRKEEFKSYMQSKLEEFERWIFGRGVGEREEEEGGCGDG